MKGYGRAGGQIGPRFNLATELKKQCRSIEKGNFFPPNFSSAHLHVGIDQIRVWAAGNAFKQGCTPDRKMDGDFTTMLSLI